MRELHFSKHFYHANQNKAFLQCGVPQKELWESESCALFRRKCAVIGPLCHSEVRVGGRQGAGARRAPTCPREQRARPMDGWEANGMGVLPMRTRQSEIQKKKGAELTNNLKRALSRERRSKVPHGGRPGFGRPGAPRRPVHVINPEGPDAPTQPPRPVPPERGAWHTRERPGHHPDRAELSGLPPRRGRPPRAVLDAGPGDAAEAGGRAGGGRPGRGWLALGGKSAFGGEVTATSPGLSCSGEFLRASL